MVNLKKINKRHLITAAIILVTVSLAVPLVSEAKILGWDAKETAMDAMVMLLSLIVNAIVYVVGQLLLIAINILIKIASFNEFVDANAVNIGWVIIRDIANMAIVIALMIIAFATVLNKQSYQIQTMLPKLVLAAVLVNFSKSITGLLIDFSQVVMMTFVHAFEGIAAGNLTYGFGLEDMLSIRGAAEGSTAEVNDWTVMGALVLGALMVIIALGIVIAMILMLLWRIVMLWILVIFSPIAFVGALIPGLSSRASQWWSALNKQLVFGPALAFMFWLSMSVISGITTQNRVMNLELESQEYLHGKKSSAVDYAYFASKMSSPQRVFDFMVTGALLIACLMVAQQAGGMAGSFAGNFMGKLQGAGKWVARRPQVFAKKGKDLAWKGVKAGAEKTGAPAMVRTMGQRFKTSGVGKKIGLDKEHTAELRAERDAKAAVKFGGERGANALQQFEYQQAVKRRKEMEEKGEFAGGEGENRTKLQADIKAGNWKDVRARQFHMAQSKDMNLSKQDNDDFEKAYRESKGFKKNGGSKKEDDYKTWNQTLMNTQKASGDADAKYKFSTREKDGAINYVDNSRKEAAEDLAVQDESSFNSVGRIKALNENIMELEGTALQGILDALVAKGDRLNVDKLAGSRNSYGQILRKLLARHHDSSDTFKLKDDELKGYEDLMQKMYARVTEQGTGRAMIDATDSRLTLQQQKRVAAGNQEFIDDTGYELDANENVVKDSSGKMAMYDPDILNSVNRKSNYKYTQKKTKAKNTGTDIPDVATETIEKDVIRELMNDNDIQSDLYGVVDKSRQPGQEIPLLVSLQNLKKKVIANARVKGNSDKYNPKSGRFYTYEELYNKSDSGKNIEKLDKAVKYKHNPKSGYSKLSKKDKEDHDKFIKNLTDSIVFDAQRSDQLMQRPPTTTDPTGSFGPNKKRVENRKINRNALSLAVGAIGKYNSTDLDEKDRENVLTELKRYIGQAKKHSKKHNSDNEQFNDELKKLEKEAKNLKVSDTISATFEDRIKKLLSQVDTK